MVKSPCFNDSTKTDCPKRKVGCSITCPEWAKYVEEREKSYKERQVRNESESASRGVGRNRRIRRLKGQIDRREYKVR